MLKSLDFNVIAHREAYMTSWSDTGESTHLKVGMFFGDHIATLNEDVVFSSFLRTYDYGRACLESK